MYVLRNLVFIFGFLIFAVSANASVGSSTKLPDQTPPVKVVATESAATRVNINSADTVTLQKIKGFGKKKAQAVVEYRTKNGAFSSVEDLLKVKVRGLNKKWLDKISNFLTV
ncbi:competence protein ComEA [Gammaproteobacteria bacterium]